MPKVETEILENRQAKLTVTVDQEQVSREMKAAAQRIAKHVNIPGFRKGKAPYHIISRHYGEEAIFEEALDPLGQTVYVEALKESGLEPYAPGTLSDLQRDPLVLTFTVPLVPVVELGEYRTLRLPYQVKEVSEDDIDAALDDLRDEHATLDPIEQPIEMGTVALLDIVGTWVRDDDSEDDEAEEQPSTWLSRKGVRVKVTQEATYPVPGFPEKVVGMSAGDERSFDIAFPADDDDLAEPLRGKTLHFEVKCNEVYSFNAPEINDEFAKDVGDFENLAALREDIRHRLQQALEASARESYITELFDHLLESIVKVSYPPVMLEEQIDDLLEDFNQRLKQQGLNLEEYRKLNNIKELELRDEFRETAARQLERALVLGEVTAAEQLRVTDEEINDEIETAILPYGAQAGIARQLFSSPEYRRSIANHLLAEKAIDRLIAIARGEEPPIGEPAPEVTMAADGPESAEDATLQAEPAAGQVEEVNEVDSPAQAEELAADAAGEAEATAGENEDLVREE